MTRGQIDTRLPESSAQRVGWKRRREHQREPPWCPWSLFLRGWRTCIRFAARMPRLSSVHCEKGPTRMRGSVPCGPGACHSVQNSGTAPVVVGRAPVVVGRAPVVVGRAPVVAGRAPVVAGRVPVVAGRTPVVAGRTPVVARQNSRCRGQNSRCRRQNSRCRRQSSRCRRQSAGRLKFAAVGTRYALACPFFWCPFAVL